MNNFYSINVSLSVNAPSRDDGVSTRKSFSASSGKAGKGRVRRDDVDVSGSAAESMSGVLHEIVGDAGVVGASRTVAFVRGMFAGKIETARVY